MLFYIMGYTATTIAAFTVILALEGPRGEGQDVSYFAGLSKDHPFLAAVMTIALLSLGGIPPTAGFFGKALVFGAAMQAGGWYILLAVTGVITSVIAVFYYFRIIVQMYMGGPAVRKVAKFMPPAGIFFTLLVAGGLTLLLGIFAGLGFDWASMAAAVLK
jgi:NADH-quinone oxidoreductase subunit N